MPPGSSGVMHRYAVARQFFFMLDGQGTILLEGREVTLQKGSRLEVPPGVLHRFCNRSGSDVIFLVISVPRSRADRINS